MRSSNACLKKSVMLLSIYSPGLLHRTHVSTQSNRIYYHNGRAIGCPNGLTLITNWYAREDSAIADARQAASSKLCTIYIALLFFVVPRRIEKKKEKKSGNPKHEAHKAVRCLEQRHDCFLVKWNIVTFPGIPRRSISPWGAEVKRQWLVGPSPAGQKAYQGLLFLLLFPHRLEIPLLPRTLT